MKELIYYYDMRKEARQEGKQEINQLNQYLAELNRIDDIIRASKDEEYQKKLLAEFHTFEAGGA